MRMDKNTSVKIRKKDYQRAVRVNITVPPQLMDVVPVILRKHGFSCFADYVQSRIRKDGGLEIVA